MKPIQTIVVILLLPITCWAQLTGAGLGTYRLGHTTIDSLNRIDFIEEDQVYVKGTIALPCPHIRLFKAGKTQIDSTSVTSLILYFYDRKLYKISCDYTETLNEVFMAPSGKSTPMPVTTFRLCVEDSSKTLSIWGESWRSKTMAAIIGHRKGYNANCQPEERARLIVVSLEVSALTSECDLEPVDPFMEAFVNVLHR